MQKGDLKFGDIAWTDFDPSIGHEFQGRRPALIIESDIQLNKSNLVTVVPITGNTQNNLLTDDILIFTDACNNLRNNSVIKMYCITSFDYLRFRKKIGKINAATSTKVKFYLRKHFDL
ncbi:MAG: type II toxin-antitoxin system PemK/MazF family toxin [Candidatus Paceibacterota bacterium]|jgi:mRNA-degrading endonuclease toxin of MazEF toxin-antitoxin module